MSILRDYLKKLKVNEFSELSEEEKATYRNWETILVGRRLTDEDTARFLDVEQQETLQKLTDPKIQGREDVFLKMKLEFIMKIKVFLNGPEMEKQMLEQNIKGLLK